MDTRQQYSLVGICSTFDPGGKYTCIADSCRGVSHICQGWSAYYWQRYDWLRLPSCMSPYILRWLYGGFAVHYSFDFRTRQDSSGQFEMHSKGDCSDTCFNQTWTQRTGMQCKGSTNGLESSDQIGPFPSAFRGGIGPKDDPGLFGQWVLQECILGCLGFYICCSTLNGNRVHILTYRKV